MKLIEDAAPKARVEMTPIMDVVFLLLVFFIYAFLTMTVQRGMKVELPRAEGALTPRETIQIILTPNDEIYLDNHTRLTLDEAVEAVLLRHNTTQLPVIIRADRQAHAGPALELMAALRDRGVKKVTYQVEKEP